MTRILALCLAALLFVAGPAVTVPSIPTLLESVRPLQLHLEKGMTLITEVGMTVAMEEAIDANICTTSNINTEKRYWLTAAHCVKDPTLEYRIDGERAIVIMRDVNNDLAILQTATVTAPALKLAKRGPWFCEDYDDKNCVVGVAGHPLGFPDPVLVYGKVDNPSTQFTTSPGFDRPFMLLDITGAPGNSGSPVVNHKGEIVSVIQIGWGYGFSPQMGGVPFNVLDQHRNWWD